MNDRNQVGNGEKPQTSGGASSPDTTAKHGPRKQRGGLRPNAGRKPIEIDLVELEKLCALQATNAEIAAWFGCSERTIETYSKKSEIAEVMTRGKAKGRISIRRAQMKLLEQGNATMGVWLGKQVLGQRDLTPIELTGPNGSAVKFTLEAIDAIFSQAENTKGKKRD